MNVYKKRFGLRNIFHPLKDLNQNNIGAGIVSGLLAIVGPPALMLEASINGNFTTSQIIFWMFSVHFFGGLFSIVMPLAYRMPIVGGHSITGVAFLTTVTAHFTFPELIGSYLFAGFLMFLVGITGIFSKLMEYIPREIIAAMLAGMILKYMANFALSLQELPFIGGISLIVYFIFSKWGNKVPPLMAAIFTAVALFLWLHPLEQTMTLPFTAPALQTPEWNVLSFLSVSLPLALLILGNDAAVGIGAIKQNGYDVPVNRVVTFSGIFSMIAALFGGQSANVAGMMSAICSDPSAGEYKKRYMGSVVSGFILVVVGIFSWKLVPFIQAMPSAFISILVGFTLLGVFANNLHTSFTNGQIRLGATFAFIIALSNVTIFHIGAPVWALLAGTLIAKFIENYRVKASEQ